MKIQINEVWNSDGRSQELIVIESNGKHPAADVYDWISRNRPDLERADGLFSHGFHARAV